MGDGWRREGFLDDDDVAGSGTRCEAWEPMRFVWVMQLSLYHLFKLDKNFMVNDLFVLLDA